MYALDQLQFAVESPNKQNMVQVEVNGVLPVATAIDQRWGINDDPNSNNINQAKMVGDKCEITQVSQSQQTDSLNVMQKISDFVDQLRIEHDEGMSSAARQGPRSCVNAPGYEEAQRRTDQVILQAEKFRADIERPPGMILNLHDHGNNSEEALNFISPGNFKEVEDVNKPNQLHGITNPGPQRTIIGEGGLSDDDFFHLTCHIDNALKGKIEKGEYVDLDKLLPKERNSLDGNPTYTNETKLEWVRSEGSTYLVPAKKNSRINCFRRWEQAFRVYATVYCTANPIRAREIWQYISVINTVSMAYNWDNVYNYDITFRQLMEFNPSRSWAVTYNQMWNLSMTNLITSNQNRRFSFSGSSNNNNSFGTPNNTNSFKKKIGYCWSFNKGVKCKFGRKCKFLERCSYCDSAAHGVYACEKLKEKQKGNASNGNPGEGKIRNIDGL